MKKAAILIPTLLFLATPAVASAATIIQNGSSNVSVNVTTSTNTGGNSVTSNSVTSTSSGPTHVSVSDSEGNTEVHVNNGDFTIKGTVKSVSGSTLNISGQNVQYNPTNLSTPSVGQYVTVKGTNQNGVLTATSITVSDSSINTSTPDPTQNPTESPTATPDTSSQNATSSSSSASPVPIEQLNGLIDQIKKLVEQIFSIFK